jgi:hypothetical protein
MNFSIIYDDVSIECFTKVTVAQAKKYVRQRYLNNGEGCSIVYFTPKGKRVEVNV